MKMLRGPTGATPDKETIVGCSSFEKRSPIPWLLCSSFHLDHEIPAFPTVAPAKGEAESAPRRQLSSGQIDVATVQPALPHLRVIDGSPVVSAPKDRRLGGRDDTEIFA